MSKAHYIRPSGPSSDADVVRLGSANNAGGNLGQSEQWKFVKLSATDTYDLAVAGDAIEGAIVAIDAGGTSGGWTIGSVQRKDKMLVIADGLQATPGTGAIAAGDYVVVGTVVAKGTYLSASTGYPKVCKATVQPGDVPATLTAAAAQVRASLNAWRVVSLGAVGTGAVGTEITIERVGRGG